MHVDAVAAVFSGALNIENGGSIRIGIAAQKQLLQLFLREFAFTRAFIATASIDRHRRD